MNNAPILPLALAGLLVLVLGAAFATLTGRRQEAIEQVNGRGAIWLMLHPPLRGIALTLAMGCMGLVISVPALAAYNGLNQWGQFAINTAVGLSVNAVLVAITISATGMFARRTAAIAALSGRVPAKTVIVGAVGFHLVALTLLMGVAVSVIAVDDVAARSRSERLNWSRASGEYALTFTGDATDFDASRSSLAALIREQQSQGHVLIAQHPSEPFQGNGPDSGNALIVNDRYLQQQCVRNLHGGCVQAADLDAEKLTLLVPSDLTDTESIRAEWDVWARFQRPNNSEDPAELARAGVRIEMVRTQSGQRVFNYGAARGDPSSTQENAVVGVLPGTTPLLSDDWLTSSSTTAQVLFDDRSAVRSALDEAGLGVQVGLIDRVSDQAAKQLVLQERSVRDTLLVGLSGAVVVVLSAVVLAGTLTQRSRRADFVIQTHGGGRHWFSVVVLGGLNLAAIPMVGSTAGLATSSELTEGPSDAVAGCISVADLTLVALLLFAQRRRVRLDTIRRS